MLTVRNGLTFCMLETVAVSQASVNTAFVKIEGYAIVDLLFSHVTKVKKWQTKTLVFRKHTLQRYRKLLELKAMPIMLLLVSKKVII